MDIDQQKAEKAALWPQIRQSLIDGLKETRKTGGLTEYLKAQSAARLTGLYERAMSDPSWKAQAFLELVRCDWPQAPFDQAALMETAGVKWSEIGPVVYQEWLFKLDSVKNMPNPFNDAGGRGAHEDGPWTWLVCAGRVASEGWGPYDLEKKGQRSKKSAPMSEAFQEGFAKVCLDMRDAATRQMRKGGADDRYLKELQRIFGETGVDGPLWQWGGWDSAMSSFEALTLSKSIAPGRGKKAAPRI